jgi:ABC-2 type transport system permease protein
MNATSAEQASPPVTEDALRGVLLAGERPPRPGPVSTSLTFGWRALLKIKHVPEQLVDVTMFPIMFTLMFTYLFGGALAGSTQEYLQFLLPGILVQANVMITMNTGITLNTDIQKGVFDRFRSLPVWRPSPLVGALLGDLVRYSIGSAIVIMLGLVLGFRPEGGAVGVVLSVALLLVVSFCLSWLWTMLSLILRTPNSVAGVIPTDVREQHLRGPEDDARVDAGGRRGQPDHPPGDRGTRPDGRLGARRGNRLGARLVRTSRRGLRSHHHGLYRKKK